ncbi:MAG TPA: hypothetical protein VF576_03180, partial [Rubricoccaceae bacterium]
MRLPYLLVALCALALPACDAVEGPPAGPSHPYGEGNGRIVVVSDLAAAQRIDVTLAGEPIGAVTRFAGCF